MMEPKGWLLRIIVLILVALLPASCNISELASTSIPPTATSTPVPPTATQIQITPSPEPTPSPSPFPTPIPLPRPRYWSGLAYDDESSLIIVVGGATGENTLADDTWTYDVHLGQWTQIETGSGTGPRHLVGGTMVYDAESDRTIWHGGLDGTAVDPWIFTRDTWSFDANSGTWEERARGPAGGFDQQMAYDSESDRVVCFGGVILEPSAPTLFTALRQGEKLGGTWTYDWNTDTWAEMEPSPSPPPRYNAAMAYHPGADRVIMFGGVFDFGSEEDRHVWAYDLNTNTWEQMGAAEGVPLEGFKMAYDAESNLIVLYGGGIIHAGGDQTWVYSFEEDAWTHMSPEDTPGNVAWHAMTYVDELDRVVLFGAMLDGDYNNPLTEPWLYDYNGNNWLPLSESP